EGWHRSRECRSRSRVRFQAGSRVRRDAQQGQERHQGNQAGREDRKIMTVVIIDNYDSFTYNLYQMVQTATTEVVAVFRNDKIDLARLLEMRPSRLILSPGPGHPANDSDFGVCKEVIVKQEQLACPVLGVCLGHQGIVHHLGGQVVGAPQIVHGKSSRVEVIAATPLFDGLPESFEAMRYHSLIASEDG